MLQQNLFENQLRRKQGEPAQSCKPPPVIRVVWANMTRWTLMTAIALAISGELLHSFCLNKTKLWKQRFFLGDFFCLLLLYLFFILILCTHAHTHAHTRVQIWLIWKLVNNWVHMWVLQNAREKSITRGSYW